MTVFNRLTGAPSSFMILQGSRGQCASAVRGGGHCRDALVGGYVPAGRYQVQDAGQNWHMKHVCTKPVSDNKFITKYSTA